MTCKGICNRHKATKSNINCLRYAEGQKRCNYCSIFMMWDDKYILGVDMHLEQNLDLENIKKDKGQVLLCKK